MPATALLPPPASEAGAKSPVVSAEAERPKEKFKEKLSVRHLSFHYGKQLAVDDATFPVYANRVTALIGPSGCGKSTLLRVFNRLYELYPNQRAHGEVHLDGQNILGSDVDLGILRGRIGMVFQNPTPFAMSIYNNVAFGPRVFASYPRSIMDGIVEDALRRAALWDEVKDNLRGSGLNLSGGQQQRLCIARAIAGKPEVLLLDEPCSALDPASTAKIEQTIAELKADHTIVIVTHNMQQAARVSEFAAFMYLGKVLEFGTTHQIFHEPRHPDTKSFVTGQIG